MHADHEITRRITTAADGLFAEAGGTQFPTVDAVRRSARVSMNDASRVMKDWRRQQLARTQPAPAQVPAALEALHRTGLAALWGAAIEQAAGELARERAAWDAERAESTRLAEEMADAFERQTAELQQLEQQAEHLQQQLAEAQAMASNLRESLHAAQARAAESDAENRALAACNAELERRAAELRSERDTAQAALAAHMAETAQAAGAALHQQDAAQVSELAALRSDMRRLMQVVSDANGQRPANATGYTGRQHP